MRRLSTVLLSLLVTAALAACGSTPEGGGATPSPSDSGGTPTTGDGVPPTTGGAATTPPATGGGATTTPAAGRGITITRSGGIAGVRESLSIKTDGSWTYNDKRGTKSETGRLTTDQLNKILQLARDPRLVNESRGQSKPGVCNDAFQYSIQIGESMLTFEDCGQDRPVTDQLLRAIAAATPM